MTSYDICPSLSDLLHSVWQSLGPSMFLQMALFRSFLWLNNTQLYICTTPSLSIPVDGYLGCFHVLAIGNSAATNIGVHISFRIMVFSGYMPISFLEADYKPLRHPQEYTHRWWLPLFFEILVSASADGCFQSNHVDQLTDRAGNTACVMALEPGLFVFLEHWL